MTVNTNPNLADLYIYIYICNCHLNISLIYIFILDILAGFNFHLSLYTKFHWIIAILNKQRFYAYPGLLLYFFYICFQLELELRLLVYYVSLV